MPPDQANPANLWDMREAGRGAVRVLGNLTLDQFLEPGQEIARLAIERELEILGEAARRVSPAFREVHPEIPWGALVGLRNVISHQYDRVDYADVFRIVREGVPALLEKLEPLLPPLPRTEE